MILNNAITNRFGYAEYFELRDDHRPESSRCPGEEEAALRAGEVVVTANGRPFAVMTRVKPDKLEEEILAIRRARAATAISRIRRKAKAKGLDRLTMEQIDAIIAEARRGRHGK